MENIDGDFRNALNFINTTDGKIHNEENIRK